jgi:hypothetical protein
MRTFITLLFCHLHSKDPGTLNKSLADDISYGVQFQGREAQRKVGQTTAHVGYILPPLIRDINLSDTDLREVAQWYSGRSSTSEEKARRSNVVSHFLHCGIMSDDEVEAYIHCFIAIDALFGIKFQTESTITRGIVNTFPHDPLWTERIGVLFDLRSELVHGGCASISNWKRLEHYTKRFRSRPTTDAKTAAMTALRQYFNPASNGQGT